MNFKPAKVTENPAGWLIRGDDGTTIYASCVGHEKTPHALCQDANLCLYEYEMEASQVREQAPMIEIGGQLMKSFSRCQFPGCRKQTDKALFNALVPSGKHFCELHLKPKYLAMVIPLVVNDSPENSYQVSA